ncbi:MAG: ribonuclease D [Bacteroidota bacterium]
MADYTILTTQQHLDDFQADHQDIDWIAIDTEFIGEKRYQTLLCLVQLATPKGLYIFDVIQLPHIQPIIDLVIDEKVLKISHAGENDYRLLHELFDITPRNIFDTQIAAGFIGYRYPISFRALVKDEMQQRVNKVQTVTDWERRPMKKRQIQYALDDVIPLKRLYDRLHGKIDRLGRTAWVAEEMEKWEQEVYYEKDPHREFFNHNQLSRLPEKQQLFLLRLYEWRRALAEKRNHSKDMILAKRNISPILKSIHLGMDGLRNNRLVSDRFVKRYADDMLDLYESPISAEEQKLLDQIKPAAIIDTRKDIKLEILYSLIQYRCLEQKIAPEMVITRGQFKRLKEDDDRKLPQLRQGWRHQILGIVLSEALQHRDRLKIDMREHEMALKIEG